MKSIARFTRTLSLVIMTAIAVLTLTGCFNPFVPDPPAKRLHNGASYNKSASNLYIAMVNPPAEYSTGTNSDKNYTIRRRFDAMQNGYPGVQSWWLHEKSPSDPPYQFLITSLEGNPVAILEVRPNGIQDDAPDPVNSQPGLDWWVSFPDGGAMNATYPASGGDR